MRVPPQDSAPSYSDNILVRGRKADVQWFFEQLGKRFSIKPPSHLSKSEMMAHLGMMFFETDAGTLAAPYSNPQKF